MTVLASSAGPASPALRSKSSWPLPSIRALESFLIVVMLLNVLSLFPGGGAAIVSERGVPPDGDVGRGMELVVERGFPLEDHFVTTSDGYILHLFRIPRPGAPPILLQHALLDSSFAFVCNFRNESLAYILSDAGFDVWMGNNRGNVYSMNHTTLDPSDGRFWAFTYDDMAAHDLPATIRHVLAVSGKSELGYVGHSEGTIQAFAGFSLPQNSDVAAAVKLFAALAPVAFVSHQRSKLIQALADRRVCEVLALLGDRSFLEGAVLNVLAPDVCRQGPRLCAGFLDLIVGPSRHYNSSRLQVYLSATPAGTSVRNMMHWGQGMRVAGFSAFDYGSATLNVRHYGTPEPPAYNLSAFSVPTALFSGGHDYLADPTDVQTLRTALEASHQSEVVAFTYRDYAHLDFTWAPDAASDVYPTLLSLLYERLSSKPDAR